MPAAESPDVLLGQAMRAAREGTLHEAEALFRRVIELRPTDAETWNRLGVVLAREGERASGVEAFTRALQLDTRHAEAHRNLAVLCDGQGQSDEAVAHYRAFLRLSSPDDPNREAVRRRLNELSAVESQR